jgi:hypothetical protein
MKGIPLLILFTIGIILWYIFTNSFTKEGFETVEDKIQDRFNPLAENQDPLKNPAAKIGISEEQGKALRDVSIKALNVPTATPTADGSFIYTDPQSTISPRIDNENSYLGLVNFCKETSKKLSNPFSDAKFAENCGVCFTSGTLITGESFTTPTGVLVYEKDKENAYKKQQEQSLLFPRVIPSMKAATCAKASLADNSEPVLAINEKDYMKYKNRFDCKDNQKFGSGCGICQSNNQWSFIDPSGSLQPSTLHIWGEGECTVKVNGIQIDKPLLLQQTKPSIFNISQVKEGSDIQIECRKQETVNGPYLYGALVGLNPNDKPFILPIEKFILKDSVTGSTPKRTVGKFFSGINTKLSKILPASGKDLIVLMGNMPLTFVESDQLAVYDCNASPFVTLQTSAELLIDDPCIKPGPTSDECIRSKLVDERIGCSTEGEWYKNPSLLNGDIKNAENVKGKLETDIQAAKNCLGKDISTPCDAYLNGGIPSKECLIYLYKNEGSKNVRVGKTYTSDIGYTSLNGNTVQFCQPAGTLNPETLDGEAELREKAKNYKGRGGIDAVKNYLSDVFDKCIGNLNIDLPDLKGGKADSWKKCINMNVSQLKQVNVNKNSNKNVI